MADRTESASGEVVLPSPCLLVLVGISGSGKSTWADAHFGPRQIASSDALRAVPAMTTSARATTRSRSASESWSVGAVGASRPSSTRWVSIPNAGGSGWAWPTRTRRASRSHSRRRSARPAPGTGIGTRPRPRRLLSGQARQFREQHPRLADDGFDLVLTEAAPARAAPVHIAHTATASTLQRSWPVGLDFGLQLPTFDWPGGASETRSRLQAIGRAAGGPPTINDSWRGSTQSAQAPSRWTASRSCPSPAPGASRFLGSRAFGSAPATSRVRAVCGPFGK